jgi:WD40 repeat protein
MNKMRTYLTKALLGVALVSAANGADEPARINFEDHVKPIFRQHCANCHHQGEKKGGLALDVFGSVIEGGGSGEIVAEGDADGSRLWHLVNHQDTPVMPPNQDKLPEEQLKLIRLWIEQGMPENSGSKVKEKKKNPLSVTASSKGKPTGPVPMPDSLPQAVPVETPRSAAVTAIAASPWAPLIAIAGQRQIAIYDTDFYELLGIIPFPDGIAQTLKFSRDGSYLVAGGGEHASHGLVAIFNIKTGERVATIGDELDTVFGADVNDTMSRVALGGPKRMLRIYDATDGSLLYDLKKHTDWIYAVAYSPDGVLVASGDRSAGLCVWEAESGRLYLDLTEHKGAIHAIAWRDDSNVLASASEDGTVKLWDVNNGKSIKTINAHGGGVMNVNFDHTGRLVTSGKDRRVKLWDAAGNLVKEFEPMSEVVLESAISYDGKRVVGGDWNGSVVMTSVDDSKQQVTLLANPEPVAVRLEKTKQSITAVQTELDPLRTRLDAAIAAASDAQSTVEAMKNQIVGLEMEAKKANEVVASSTIAVTSIDTELPRLTTAGRDLHDQVIASRLNGNDLAKLAELEQTLGQQLLDLAGKRRRRLELQAEITQQQQVAKEKTEQAAALVAMLPALEKTLVTTSQAKESAQVSHDTAARRLTSLQKRLELLQKLES